MDIVGRVSAFPIYQCFFDVSAERLNTAIKNGHPMKSEYLKHTIVCSRSCRIKKASDFITSSATFTRPLHSFSLITLTPRPKTKRYRMLKFSGHIKNFMCRFGGMVRYYIKNIARRRQLRVFWFLKSKNQFKLYGSKIFCSTICSSPSLQTTFFPSSHRKIHLYYLQEAQHHGDFFNSERPKNKLRGNFSKIFLATMITEFPHFLENCRKFHIYLNKLENYIVKEIFPP